MSSRVRTAHTEVAAHTKERIISTSTRLFATESYNGVSMRDIAKAVGIKSSSIYNYYPSKEDLLREILETFSIEHHKYFAWINTACRDLSDPAAVLDKMFDKLLQVDDIYAYYGVVILLKEQFTNKMAREMAFHLFHIDNVEVLRTLFDRLAQQGSVPATADTQTMAAFCVYCVLIGSTLRMHELLGHPMPVNCTQMYRSLRDFLLSALEKGI